MLSSVPFVAALLLALASLSGAQDLNGLPSCGQTCLITAFSGGSNGGCSQTDFACLCKSQTFTAATVQCYRSQCSAADAASSIEWGTRTCASVGIQVVTSNGTNSTTTAGKNAPTAASTNTSTSTTSPNSAASGAKNSAASFVSASSLPWAFSAAVIILTVLA